MIIAEFSIVPVDGMNMKPIVDAAVEVVEKSGLKYEVDAMSTTIEGELDQIFDVVQKAHQAAKQKGADRLLTELRIDDRVEGVSIEEEVKPYRAAL